VWGSCGALAAFVLRAATAWRALDSLPPLNACVSFDHVFGFCVEFGVPSPQPLRSCSDGRVGSFAPPNHMRAFAMRSAARLFACACTFTIASRLYGCGFCACDSSYGSTALTCARTCEALLLVGTCCGFCDACDSSCESPRLPCCLTMHGVASSLLFIKKEERALPFVHARCVALAAVLELCWACACCCCCSSSPDVESVRWPRNDLKRKEDFFCIKLFI
jgi:hypothetical protein